VRLVNVVWGFLLWLGSGVAVIALMGVVGLGNLALLGVGASWKMHLAVWVGCVVTLVAMLLAFPETIYTKPDLHFSDERAICGLYDAPWVC